MGYKKQDLRSAKTPIRGPQSGALAAAVLSKPENFPSEFLAWLPRYLNTNAIFSIQTTQLPSVEKRNLVGNTGNAAFQNSWANFGSGNESAQYYKDPFGRVWIGGVVKSGGVPATIFTLPAGYRPEESKVYSVASNGAFGICTVNADGTVVASAGNNTYFSMSGVSFRQYG